MKTKTRSMEQIIEEQVHRWQLLQQTEKSAPTTIEVITLSREPGSGGQIIAETLSRNLQYDLFDHEIIQAMSHGAHTSSQVIETLDERGLNLIEDWISSFVNLHHLWPDQYLKYLMKTIGTMGAHGRAIIIGRGANYAIEPEKRFSVRVVAPLEIRVKNVCRKHSVTPEEAKRRIIRTESDRRAFVRKYFNADLTDPLHYDLVMNTGHLSIDAAVAAITSAFQTGRQATSSRQ